MSEPSSSPFPMKFPPASAHQPQVDTLPEWTAAAQQAHTAGQPWHLPLTNAAAVFVAAANLGETNGACSVRALRVSSSDVTAWDSTPIVAYGQPGSTQTAEGVPGLLWPIYSRDMAIARGSMSFVVALATGKPTPELPDLKAESGLWDALRCGVQGPADVTAAGGVSLHAVSVTRMAAHVWLQRTSEELVDGEPPVHPPFYLAVDLSVPLTTILAAPDKHLRASVEGVDDIIACILERLSKLRMRGRKAGEPAKPRATKADGATPELVAELRQQLENAERRAAAAEEAQTQQARLYAEQLGQLQGVPYATAAGYFATMLSYLRPDAPFQAFANQIRTEQPDLFTAIATRMQG